MRRPLLCLMAVIIVAASCSDSDDNPSGEPESETETSTTTAEGSDGVATPDASNPDSDELEPAPPSASVALAFTVEGVIGGQNVPVEFTCDGANETPAVTIEGVPPDVVELALVVDDPDAPTDSPFVHWVVYGIGPDTLTVTDGDTSLTYGLTDTGTEMWFGPCPPSGDGLHAYRWKLFGLSSALGLAPGLDGRALEEAITGSVVTDALLISTYERAS